MKARGAKPIFLSPEWREKVWQARWSPEARERIRRNRRRDQEWFYGYRTRQHDQHRGARPTPQPSAGPYETLGLKPGASHCEIRSAYRRLAMQFHPDRNPAGAERMKAINVAYEKLC